MGYYDCIIIGSGPAGLGAAFTLIESSVSMRILILEKDKMSTGGLRNDCKMNFTYPIGFSADNWNREQAEKYLAHVMDALKPEIMVKNNISIYQKRAKELGVELLDIRQAHLGTDGGIKLIHELTERLSKMGVEIALGEHVVDIDHHEKSITTQTRVLTYGNLIIAPGRKGYKFLQEILDKTGTGYVDHTVDIGLRIEAKVENYSIVNDYYDPKFMFPGNVRTFCTNSGSAHVVQERYTGSEGGSYLSVNGHSWSSGRPRNGLVNFAMLHTVALTEPVASGQRFAEILGIQATLLGGGKPIMQRVGDFRLGKRSKASTFNADLYDFNPTLPSCTPGDISLAMPSKILRNIWRSLKYLDTIVPGVLHPSTIMYYPEIKLYANKPAFTDSFFQTVSNIYMIGDGAGTSRGITAAWASGIRAARGILGLGDLT